MPIGQLHNFDPYRRWYKQYLPEISVYPKHYNQGLMRRLNAYTIDR